MEIKYDIINNNVIFYLSKNLKSGVTPVNRIIRYLMDQKLLINLVVIMIFVAGLYAVSQINRETIPNISMDMVSIVTIYPGASPNDAEELISIPIEKKLRSVSGLDKVRSYNVENVSLVVVYLKDSAKDKKKVVQDIKDAVEGVGSLPATAYKPLVQEIVFDNTVLTNVAFTGKDADVPYEKIREFANQAEDFFYDIDGIAQMDKFGYYDREYLVEINPDALDKYRIGINTLINTLRVRNIDLPGGTLRIGKKEFVLRVKGQFKNAEEILNTAIMGNDVGVVTRIRDVAKVTDTYKEADVHHRFNGKKAVVFRLWKTRAADEIELSNRLRKAVAGYSVPGYKDISIQFFDDQSVQTRQRLSSVLEEAALGAAILGIFMLWLMGRRMSGLVILGIPISFMIALLVMWQQGHTLNIVSLFGLIMVLGMIVDFSIVIAENSHRYMERGLGRRAAIEKGVSEVFLPVTITMVCIVTAFMPLMFITGFMGKFIKIIPIVIITCLVSSWFIAMFILPTYMDMFLHEKHRKKKDNGELSVPMRVLEFIISIFSRRSEKDMERMEKTREARLKREDKNFETGGFAYFQRMYKKLVSRSLKHRYITVSILIILFFISLAIIPFLGFRFMPPGGEELIRVKVKLPYDTNLQTNLEEMKKLEKVVSVLHSDELIGIHTYVGEEYSEFHDPKPGKATYNTTIHIYLTPEKDRKRLVSEIDLDIRNRIEAARKKGLISDDTRIKVEVIGYSNKMAVGKPVNVEIRGKDYEIIKKIAAEYFDYLSTIKGLRDISIDLEEGKTEYRYNVDEKMTSMTGISALDVALSLNASFAGAVATKVNQDEEEVGVRVRFNEKERSKRESLHDVKVANRTGGLVPLDLVTNVKTVKEYSQINRLNFKRLVQVQAEIEGSKTTPGEITELLQKKFADIEKRYPGYLVAYGGEQESSDKSMAELQVLFIAALLVIFVVLTVYMRSLVMPVVIMIAIPFALIGVVFAVAIHRQPLSFFCVLGLFSLAGIIVSNTLVLVQFINKFRDEGLGLKEAITEGGVVRLRPIILTAGSIVLELMPVIYGVGGKDYMIAPLALAFGYGLIFATIITLILIPCFYHIAEDMKGRLSKIGARFGVAISPVIYKQAAGNEK